MAIPTNDLTTEPRRFSIPMPRPIWIGAATAILVAVAIGLFIGLPIYRRQLAIREIERLDGRIKTRPRGPGWLRERVGKERMMMLFDEVTCVDLDGSQTTDVTLQHIGNVTDLQTLSLSRTLVSDAGLADLKRLTRLQWLSLDATQVTDSGIVYLSGLTHLEILSLDQTQITDAGLKSLGDLTRLRRLGLRHTQVTGIGFKSLDRLSKLEEIYLSDAPVTDSGLEHHFKGMTGLFGLDLSRTPVTDKALPHLARVKSLLWLEITGTHVTESGVRELKRTLSAAVNR